jgi:hypothetical protein
VERPSPSPLRPHVQPNDSVGRFSSLDRLTLRAYHQGMMGAWLLLTVAPVTVLAASELKVAGPARYSGMCDASGGAALDQHLFAVANDEDNVLRVYRNDLPGPPVATLDVAPFLSLHGKFPETDLEGATRLGDRIFWIGSHGRNRTGKERENRHCFFATDLKRDTSGIRLEPVGQPYKSLLTDLVSDARLAPFNLAQAASLAPNARGALNIEGLSATPDGRLLIGFRNPVPDGKALLVPLLNPNEVIQGTRAKLGDPIRLDLQGLGIRDLAYAQGVFWIIAGHTGGSGHSRLYRWAGGSATPEWLPVKHFKRYNPEAIVVYPDRPQGPIQLLSDDGTRSMGGTPCKGLKDPNARSFRSFWVHVEESPASLVPEPPAH